MTILHIHGGDRLSGRVHPARFKHSVVTAIAVGALSRAPVTIVDPPDIVEMRVLAGLLAAAGADVACAPGRMTIEARGLGQDMELAAAGAIHGSVYLAPAFLARNGVAHMTAAGGCRIGAGAAGLRPFGHYVKIFRRFGAEVAQTDAERLTITAHHLTGTEIDLLDFVDDRGARSGPLFSGASKMALLCAAIARGTTVLRHLYPKPDVMDLPPLLARMGARVDWLDAHSVRIEAEGGAALAREAAYDPPADLIELTTWIVVGALLARDRIVIEGPGLAPALAAIEPERGVLARFGVVVEGDGDTLTITPTKSLRPTSFAAQSCGVFSDAQPLLALLACHAPGRSCLTDLVWSGRFAYADGLAQLGARIDRRGGALTLQGPTQFRAGQRLTAPDLRAAAAYVIAALCIPGETIVDDAGHLPRGYEGLVDNLRLLGARIETL